MTTLEKIAEVMKSQKGNGVFQVEVRPEGYIYSQLENRVDPSQPYTLTVHLLPKERTLQIRIPLINAEQQDIPIPRVSASATISLAGGNLKVDSKTGVSFELDYIYQDNDGNDLLPELFEQLIERMFADFRQFEMLILQGQRMFETLMQIVPTT